MHNAAVDAVWVVIGQVGLRWHVAVGQDPCWFTTAIWSERHPCGWCVRSLLRVDLGQSGIAHVTCLRVFDVVQLVRRHLWLQDFL